MPKPRRIAALSLPLALILFFSVLTAAHAEPVSISSGGIPDWPDLSGNTAAWVEGAEIFTYSLSAGMKTQRTSDGAEKRYPAVGALLGTAPYPSSRWLVWQDYRNDDGTMINPDIYALDLATPGAAPVAVKADPVALTGDEAWRGRLFQMHPDVSGDWAVWEDSEVGVQFDIYAKNLSSGETRCVTCPNLSDQRQAAIHYPWIVWTDYRGGQADLWAYNISTAQTRQLTNDPAWQNYPPDIEVSANTSGQVVPKVVWMDWRNGNPDIFYLEIGAGASLPAVVPITTNPDLQSDPHIGANRVYWQDWRNGNIYLFDTGWNPDIYMYDLLAKQEVPVAIDSSFQQSPAASGLNVIWQDYSLGSPSIFLEQKIISIDQAARFTLDSAVSIALLPPGPELPFEMQLSNDLVLWVTKDWATTVTPWLLSPGQGLKRVWVRFRSNFAESWAGRPTYADDIFLDSIVPSGTVSINAGAANSDTPAVTLALTASDGANCLTQIAPFSPESATCSGVDQMRIANSSAGLDAATWEPFVSERSWNLTDGPGPKTVYVQFRDRAQNVSSTATDDITVLAPMPAPSPTTTTTLAGGGFAPPITTATTVVAFQGPPRLAAATTTSTTLVTAKPPAVTRDLTPPRMWGIAAKPNPFSTQPRVVKTVVQVPFLVAGQLVKRPAVRATTVTGTTFQFGLNEVSAVTMQIKSLVVPTKRVLVKGKAKVRGKVRVTSRWIVVKGKPVWVPLVAFGPYPKKVGTNSMAWNGKVRGKPVAPGTYQAIFRAKDAAGNMSPPYTILVRVLAPPPVKKPVVKKKR